MNMCTEESQKTCNLKKEKITNIANFIDVTHKNKKETPWIILTNNEIYHSSLISNCIIMLKNKEFHAIQNNEFDNIRVYEKCFKYYQEYGIINVTALFDNSSMLIGFLCELNLVYINTPTFVYAHSIFKNTTINNLKDYTDIIINKLAPRERQICYFLLQGMRSRQIMDEINELFDTHISQAYIRNVIRQIYEKFNVYNRVELFSIITKQPELYGVEKKLFEAIQKTSTIETQLLFNTLSKLYQKQHAIQEEYTNHNNQQDKNLPHQDIKQLTNKDTILILTKMGFSTSETAYIMNTHLNLAISLNVTKYVKLLNKSMFT